MIPLYNLIPIARNWLNRWIAALGVDSSSTEYYLLLTLGVLIGCIIIPYLIGSCNFAIIWSKIIKHDDIRNYGSGNAGTTNVLRTYGKGMAVLVFTCELLKTAVAMIIGALLLGNEGAPIAGLFAIVGHMFPIYYKFKGGKGVACSAMAVLMISPITFGILLMFFIIIVVGTKYVSLGSVMGMLLCPVILSSMNAVYNNMNPDSAIKLGGMSGLCSVIMAVLVVFMHRSNIKRLLSGTESKISFKKKAQPANETPTEPEKISNRQRKEQSNQMAAEDMKDYIKCEKCGRIIPIGRKKCAYCNTLNSKYDPSRDIFEKEKKKDKK